jgi:hypothetical protein
LPADEIETVRSRIPGSDAIGSARPRTQCAVHLVGHHYEVVPHPSAAMAHFGAREDAAGRVAGGVEQHQPRLADRGLSAHAEPERRRHERHNAGLGLREGDPGQVGVVERLEHHDLVARIEERRDRRAKCLGGPGVDRDLARRVVRQPVKALLVVGDRLLQAGRPGIGESEQRAHGLGRGLLELGAVEVRSPGRG